MKNIKKTLLTVAAFLVFASYADAQKGLLKFDLNYNYSFPTGTFNSDLVKNGSPRGVRGAIMYSFTDKLAAGLESGFQDYYQKYPRDLYSIGKSQDISAVLTNSIQTTPFLLKAKYTFDPASTIQPYVSLGAGANMISFNQYFGEFANNHTNIGFLAEAGAGVKIPFGKMKTAGVDVGAAYDFAPYKKFGYNDLNNFNVKAGIYFKLD